MGDGRGPSESRGSPTPLLQALFGRQATLRSLSVVSGRPGSTRPVGPSYVTVTTGRERPDAPRASRRSPHGQCIARLSGPAKPYIVPAMRRLDRRPPVIRTPITAIRVRCSHTGASLIDPGVNTGDTRRRRGSTVACKGIGKWCGLRASSAAHFRAGIVSVTARHHRSTST